MTANAINSAELEIPSVAKHDTIMAFTDTDCGGAMKSEIAKTIISQLAINAAVYGVHRSFLDADVENHSLLNICGARDENGELAAPRVRANHILQDSYTHCGIINLKDDIDKSSALFRLIVDAGAERAKRTFVDGGASVIGNLGRLLHKGGTPAEYSMATDQAGISNAFIIPLHHEGKGTNHEKSKQSLARSVEFWMPHDNNYIVVALCATNPLLKSIEDDERWDFWMESKTRADLIKTGRYSEFRVDEMLGSTMTVAAESGVPYSTFITPEYAAAAGVNEMNRIAIESYYKKTVRGMAENPFMRQLMLMNLKDMFQDETKHDFIPARYLKALAEQSAGAK